MGVLGYDGTASQIADCLSPLPTHPPRLKFTRGTAQTRLSFARLHPDVLPLRL